MIFLKRVFALGMFLCALEASAQNAKIRLVQSDYLEGIKTTEGVMQKVYNGTFEHENTLLKSDSSYYYPAKNAFEAFGHVHILQGDSLDITADFLKYDGNTHLASLHDNVRLTDKQAVLTTAYLTYDLRTRIAYYETGGRLVNKSNVLLSKKGYYHVKTRDAYFRYNVEVTTTNTKIVCDTLRYNLDNKCTWFYGPSKIYGEDDVMYTENGKYNTATEEVYFGKKNEYWQQNKMLKGDSLYYNRKKGQGYAKRNVVFKDTLNKALLKGQYATYKRQYGEIVVTEKPYSIMELEKKNTVQKDSLWLSADTIVSREVLPERKKIVGKDSALVSLKDTSKYRIVYAYRKVKLFKDDIQGKADSVSFSSCDSVFRLYKEPMLWAQGSQMSADTILMKVRNKRMDKMYLKQKCFLVNLDADSVSFNQIKGRFMDGTFVENELVNMLVIGNAETIYYAKNKTETVGVNRSTSGKLNIHFANAKVDNITFLSKPDMRFVPFDKKGEEEYVLEGFVWKPTMRPKSKWEIISDLEPSKIIKTKHNTKALSLKNKKNGSKRKR